jgi:glycosyltransferase involved in cell wall biosynthesis
MQTHASHLARHLARRADLEVLTYRITDASLAEEAKRHDEACGYPVRRVLSRLGYWHNLSLLAHRIRDFRADAVYASTVFYGLLRHTANVPVVCRSVGNDVLRPWLGYPFPLASRWIATPALQRVLRWWLEHGHHPDWVDMVFREARERLMRRAAPAHARILANSDYTADLLRGIGVEDGRIDVIAGGVDTSRFSPPPHAKAQARRRLGLGEDDTVLLTVCRLVAKKGVEVLLEAFARLRATDPRLRLVIVGDGARRRAYEREAAALGVGDFVRFDGRVPHDSVPPYFWAADLFVLASYEASYAGGAARDVETMGRVLCEANAAKLPVVATRTGGTPSVIRDGWNGPLVRPNDAASLADAIARMLQEPALAERLAERGWQRAHEDFDWSAVMARNEQAIEQALSAS